MNAFDFVIVSFKLNLTYRLHNTTSVTYDLFSVFLVWTIGHLLQSPEDLAVKCIKSMMSISCYSQANQPRGLKRQIVFQKKNTLNKSHT